MEPNPWPRSVELVRAVVTAAPNREFVGDVRFQRAVYFLDRMGWGSGFVDWDMESGGGPRSERLEDALRLAETLRGVKAETRRRRTDSMGYRVFHPLFSDAVPDAAWGRLGEARVREVIGILHEAPATVVDVAAAVDWFANHQGREDWQGEVEIRKGVMASVERLQAAVTLLGALGLPVPAQPVVERAAEPEVGPDGLVELKVELDLNEPEAAIALGNALILARIVEWEKGEQGLVPFALAQARGCSFDFHEAVRQWVALETLEAARPGMGVQHMAPLRERVKAEVAELMDEAETRPEEAPAV